MKKFLFVVALIVGVIVSQFIVPSQAQAEEIFAASETRGGKTSNYYVVTESIQHTDYGFKVRIHSVGQNFSENKYWEAGFTQKNGEWHVIWLPSSYTTPLSQDQVARQIFRIAQLFM